MKKLSLSTLVVNDDDLECTKKKPTLDNLSLRSVGFVASDLEKFDCIVYKGKLGTKVLKIKV